MPTAAIYSRQSYYKEDSCSVDMQIERGKAFCVSQGWDYIIYDTDRGYSGKDTDRPGFRKMMQDIEAGKINHVVVYKLDRISRNLSDFFGLMEQFKKHDVGFRSLTENFDTTTPMGRAMLAIIAVFAQLERETTAERVTDNMIDRAIAGIWNGGPVPFGFKAKKVKTQIAGSEKTISILNIDPIEEKYLHKFYEWYLEPNGSIRNNVMKANQKAIPTKTGKAWNPNQMQRIISNPLYCIADQAAYEYFSSLGVQVADKKENYNGEYGLMWYNRRKPHGKTSRLRDMSEWIITIGKHKGIIPGEKFVAAQKKREENRVIPARAGTGRKGLLAWLIKCGKCNKSMVFSDYGERNWVYYRCRANQLQGPAVCAGQTVNGNEIEKVVIDTIKNICTNKEFLEGIARKAMEDAGQNSGPLLEDRKRLNSKLNELSTEQKELVKAIGKKTLPMELIEERISEIENEKAPLLNQLEEVETKLANQDWVKVDMETVFGNLLKFNEVFDELEFEEKRNFLRSIVKEIVYDEGNIKISLYFMPEITPNKPPGGNNISDTLVMNPCPCGHYGSDKECNCSPLQISRYLSRVSGPLLDRMDLHVEVGRVKYEQLTDRGHNESSAVIREKVKAARELQISRFKNISIKLNSQMKPQDVRQFCQIDKESEQLLKNAFTHFNMSARAYDRVLKIARTIADLDLSQNIQLPHIAESLKYRTLDKKYWG